MSERRFEGGMPPQENNESKRFKKPEVGDIVKADILDGEIADGRAAGLDPRIKLEGVGQVNLREVYDEDELTEFAGPNDTTWGARIIEVPSEDEESWDGGDYGFDREKDV